MIRGDFLGGPGRGWALSLGDVVREGLKGGDI